MFTDVSVLRDGHVLQLPLDMYDVFKQRLPVSRKASVASVKSVASQGAGNLPASRRASGVFAGRAGRRSSTRRRRMSTIYYSDVVKGETRRSARQAAAVAATLRQQAQTNTGAPIEDIPMVVFDDRGRPCHSFYEDDVRSGAYDFLYANPASAATDIVSLQEDVAGTLAGKDAGMGVDAIMVVLVLALFCDGESEDQLTLAFRCFDADNSNDMDQVRREVCCFDVAPFT